MMPKKAKIITIEAIEYTVKELGILQVAELMEYQDKHQNENHVIDFLFGDHVPAIAISLSTGISMDELAALVESPSDIAELIEGVKEVNGFLSKALERKAKENAAFHQRLMDMAPEMLVKITKNLLEKKSKEQPVN